MVDNHPVSCRVRHVEPAEAGDGIEIIHRFFIFAFFYQMPRLVNTATESQLGANRPDRIHRAGQFAGDFILIPAKLVKLYDSLPVEGRTPSPAVE